MSELILQTRDLTRRYGHTLALDHAALSVEKGQIFGLVGRNGAGKTTLIRLISGQSHPTAGEVTLFGASTPAALARARSRTGAMVEIPSFYPYLTARQNLEYYRIQRGIPGKECVDEALEQVRLTDTGKKEVQDLLPGHEAAAGPGPGPDEPPGVSPPGRAHQRPGPGGHRGVPGAAPPAEPGAADHHFDLQPHPLRAVHPGHPLRLH